MVNVLRVYKNGYRNGRKAGYKKGFAKAKRIGQRKVRHEQHYSRQERYGYDD